MNGDRKRPGAGVERSTPPGPVAPRRTLAKMRRAGVGGARRAVLRLAWVAGLAAALGACGSGPHASSMLVTYGVTGTACKADIAYQDLTHTSIAVPGQGLPWNTTFAIPASQVNGFPLLLSATNLCAIGFVSANAEVNGSLFATQTSFAPNGAVEIAVNLF